MSTEIESPEAVESGRVIGESIPAIIDDLRKSASVESVYGDAIEVGDLTMIPVARIAYGFGGGFGSGDESDAEEGGGEGGGVGGGVSARPVGVVEVSDGQTRFVRFNERRMQLVAVGAGLLLGLLLGRRRGGT